MNQPQNRPTYRPQPSWRDAYATDSVDFTSAGQHQRAWSDKRPSGPIMPPLQPEHERMNRSTNRTAVSFDDDWTNSSVRDIRRPDGGPQKRTSADFRKEAYARRRSTVATRSASTAAAQYSAANRASALRGDRILIDDDSLRMDKITHVRQPGSDNTDPHLQPIGARVGYKQDRQTPAQVAANRSYKDSNIYSRNRAGRDVYASQASERQWSSIRKERQRQTFIKIGIVAVGVIIVLAALVSCIVSH